MKLRQLSVWETVTFVIKSSPEECSCVSSSEVYWHESLISVDWHQLIFIAININSGVIAAISDLVENSCLQGFIRIVVADFWTVVVAVERRVFAFANVFSAGVFLSFLEQHFQDGFEDLFQTIFWWFCQLLSVVDVVVDAVHARHGVFTWVRRHFWFTFFTIFFTTQKYFWILYCVARLNASKTCFVLDASLIRSILLYMFFVLFVVGPEAKILFCLSLTYCQFRFDLVLRAAQVCSDFMLAFSFTPSRSIPLNLTRRRRKRNISLDADFCTFFGARARLHLNSCKVQITFWYHRGQSLNFCINHDETKSCEIAQGSGRNLTAQTKAQTLKKLDNNSFLSFLIKKLKIMLPAFVSFFIQNCIVFSPVWSCLDKKCDGRTLHNIAADRLW